MRGLICLVLVGVMGLTGCAVQVTSSTPRTVTISAGTAQIGEAQKAADAECAKHNRLARLSGKIGQHDFVYDCVS